MTGDQTDVLKRLKGRLPRWFGSGPTPVLDALLQGPAWALAYVYSLWAYAKLQTRIGTATDGFLDLISGDFFGSSLPRKAYESDASFRFRILSNLIRLRNTRRAVVNILTQITGRAPIVFEPGLVTDTGAMHAPLSRGYCGVARMGSLAMPFEAFVTAFRPIITGGLAGSGYCNAPTRTAMNAPTSLSYLNSISLQQALASDADIYAAVESVRPTATVVGVAISY